MPKYKLHKVLIGGGFKIDDKCEKLGFPPLPSIVNTDRSITKRIIAIGDIHGDLDLAINSLEVGGIIERVKAFDEKTCVLLNYKEEIEPRIYKWIAKSTIVVQVGDQVDRCRPMKNECTDPDETVNDEASDVKIMFFFHDLHLVAINSPGCAVYSLLGNHELLNVLGNLRYVSYKGLEEFRTDENADILDGRKDAFGLKSNRLLFKSKTNIANFLACSRVSAIIVDGYLFVHAGVLEKLISYTAKNFNVSKTKSIEKINESIRNWLLNLDTIEDKKYTSQVLGGKVLSPFWPRIFGNLPSDLDSSNKLCESHVKPVLDVLNINGIVVGHTPQLKFGISSTCSKSVWRIDVAGSQAFDRLVEGDMQVDESVRVPQVLEIKLGLKQSEDEFNILKKIYS
jgi:hypothetical protein